MKRLRRRHVRRRKALAGTWLGAEHRRERDEGAEVNIPPHLLSTWRRVKRQFRGTPHQRYEQFTQYIHDHGEDMGAMQDEADARLDEMLRSREACNPNVPCSAECRMATGPVCHCSCGGQNHGCQAVAA